MDIKQLLCIEMYGFIVRNLNEFENRKIFGRVQTYKELGFKDRNDMLNQIKTNPEITIWENYE